MPYPPGEPSPFLNTIKIDNITTPQKKPRTKARQRLLRTHRRMLNSANSEIPLHIQKS